MSDVQRYRILSGSFRVSDALVAQPGDIIELNDDVAERYTGQLELVPDGIRLTGPVVAGAAADPDA